MSTELIQFSEWKLYYLGDGKCVLVYCLLVMFQKLIRMNFPFKNILESRVN